MRIIRAGKAMQDGRTLCDCSIMTNGTVVHLAVTGWMGYCVRLGRRRLLRLDDKPYEREPFVSVFLFCHENKWPCG